jgi:hypothetical protein
MGGNMAILAPVFDDLLGGLPINPVDWLGTYLLEI